MAGTFLQPKLSSLVQLLVFQNEEESNENMKRFPLSISNAIIRLPSGYKAFGEEV